MSFHGKHESEWVTDRANIYQHTHTHTHCCPSCLPSRCPFRITSSFLCSLLFHRSADNTLLFSIRGRNHQSPPLLQRTPLTIYGLPASWFPPRPSTGSTRDGGARQTITMMSSGPTPLSFPRSPPTGTRGRKTLPTPSPFTTAVKTLNPLSGLYRLNPLQTEPSTD